MIHFFYTFVNINQISNSSTMRTYSYKLAKWDLWLLCFDFFLLLDAWGLFVPLYFKLLKSSGNLNASCDHLFSEYPDRRMLSFDPWCKLLYLFLATYMTSIELCRLGLTAFSDWLRMEGTSTKCSFLFDICNYELPLSLKALGFYL